jgi:hypothetical protein
MREISDLPGIQQEEELACYEIGVVQDQRILLDKGLAAPDPCELELPGRDIAVLLCPHRLEIQGTGLSQSPEPEIPSRNPLGEKARFREPESHVTHLHPLEELSSPSLVIHVHVVGGGELPGLVVVDIHMNPVRNDSPGLEAELDVGAELGEEPRVAADL